MFAVKKRILVGVFMLSYLLLVSHETTCSSVSLPTRADVALFKAIAPRMVSAIPDSALKSMIKGSNPKEIKGKLRQIIVAGSDVFDLALAIESGELTTEFKDHLNVIRTEFNALNAKLSAEYKNIQNLKAKLLDAKTTEQKVSLLEEQTLVMLDMFASMSDPMFNVSVAFKDLNGMLVAKLLQVLELIPPIQPYLTVGTGTDKITLSKFMGVKLQEMIVYTQALKTISTNLKITFNQLRADMLQCKKDLTKSYQSVLAQKQLLPQAAPASQLHPEPVQNEPDVEQVG